MKRDIEIHIYALPKNGACFQIYNYRFEKEEAETQKRNHPGKVVNVQDEIVNIAIIDIEKGSAQRIFIKSRKKLNIQFKPLRIGS